MNEMEIFVICPTISESARQVEKSVHAKTRLPHKVSFTGVRGSCCANHNAVLDRMEGEFAISLHDDLEILTDNWLELLLETAQRDKQIALVGSKLVLPDGKIHSCGTADNLKPYCVGEMDRGQREHVEEVTALDCNVYLYRKEAFKDIRFDERFTGSAPFSDTDISLELRKKGWKCYYDGRVKVLHLKPQINGKWWEWNHLYFHLKHPTTLWTQYRRR